MLPIYLLLAGALFLIFLIFLILKREQMRRKILQAFIAGIIRSVSDYVSSTDDHSEIPQPNTKLPIPYKKIIESVEYELLKSVPMESYGEKWLLKHRQLFIDEKSSNDGFIFMNFDLFDDLIKLWRSN